MHDPRPERFLRTAVILGALAVLLVPAARGSSDWFGFLPLWLLGMPLAAWWSVAGFPLPRAAVALPRRRRAQARRVMAQVDRRLAECGSDRTRILRAQIYLADIADIGAMNAVWDAWVVPGTAPPRATVQAALADPAWRIEIVVTAAVAPGKS